MVMTNHYDCTPLASVITLMVFAQCLPCLHNITGVRATHGITAGRFWFSVRVLEPLETTAANIGDSADAYNDDETTANTIHCCRCDWCWFVSPGDNAGSSAEHTLWSNPHSSCGLALQHSTVCWGRLA
jgi:hypothetical protein